jgi:hypothetical protein
MEEASPDVLREMGAELLDGLERAKPAVEAEELALEETFIGTPVAV